jgi:hypothetical protein
VTRIRIAALVALLALAACRTIQPVPPAPAVADPDAVAALVRRHNERVERLRRLHSTGVLEFEWLDADGKRHHEPQVNMTLWLDVPKGTALRAEKLGENLLWIGSNAERYWIFDLTSKPRRLHEGPHAEPIRHSVSPLVVRPLALLDLLGLSPIADDPADVAATPGAVVVTTEGRGGPMRLHFDEATGMPGVIETLGPDGRVTLRSRLDRVRTVPVSGVSVADRPGIATRIRIDDRDGTVSIGLFLDEPGPEDPGDRWARVFDYPRLVRAFRPEIVNGRPVE